MTRQFDYTTFANRFNARFPFLTYISIQMNAWILANLLLVTILNFYDKIIGQAYEIPIGGRFGTMAVVAIVFGGVYGVCLGFTGYYLDKTLYRKISLGKVILLKAAISLTLLSLLFWILRFVIFDSWIEPSLYLSDIDFSESSWKYLFYLLLIYYFFVTLIVSFINQVNNKYGPGVLIPLLLGRFRNPREEERTFMFMDLKSSTTTAEKLGHLKYSAFIRDCFADINVVLFPFNAQVYQYVGDEIVITWPKNEGFKNHDCIQFYYACKKQFRDKSEYYMANYGLLPTFKASAHTGKVTAVEIGEVKKDIAYHGDTLNIAARIQSLCNEYQSDFLVSEYLLAKIGSHRCLRTENLGKVQLRGKADKVGLISVNWID